MPKAPKKTTEAKAREKRTRLMLLIRIPKFDLVRAEEYRPKIPARMYGSEHVTQAIQVATKKGAPETTPGKWDGGIMRFKQIIPPSPFGPGTLTALSVA